MNRRSWHRAIAEAAGVLLLVALLAHVTYALLRPLIPLLIAAVFGVLLIGAVFRDR
jgi:hypothetical protein